MGALPEDLEGARIAVVNEWIDAYGGAEQVFEAIAQIFPTADVYALTAKPGVNLDFGGRPVHTTFLDRDPLRERRGLTLPLMPLAWRLLGKPEYDLVISSHHAFAHANHLTRPGGKHLSYVHSPARYLWSADIDSRGDKWYLAPPKAVLRRYDLAVSERVDSYAANSSAVAARIRNFWGRASTVVHPPARVEYFNDGAKAEGRDYVLGFGRWIPYKNLHLVIEAADIAGLPVKIAGRGPDRAPIDAAARAAKVPVEIIHSPSDAELRDLYQGAACLVFPTVEDFGIVPVEAQAAGVPVVAPASGGALDTVIPGSSGVLVDGLEPAVLAAAVKQAIETYSFDGCTANAARFSKDQFVAGITSWVEQAT
jgi:glycosyltransferase involved in cell wall biosynthesis